MSASNSKQQSDPLIDEMEQTASKPMCDEARLLIRLAIEAQQTGKMPDLSALKGVK